MRRWQLLLIVTLVFATLLTACAPLSRWLAPPVPPTAVPVAISSTVPTIPATSPPPHTPTPAPLTWGPQIRVVAEPTPGTSPTWSPDGKSLAYIGPDVGLVVVRAPDFVPTAVYSRPFGAPLWSPDGESIASAAGSQREVDGSTYQVVTLVGVAPDGSVARDLLPGWQAAINGPSFAKQPVGWLDEHTLAFGAHCGTECAMLYAIDVASGKLLDLSVYGPAFHVEPGRRWAVAQSGPSGGFRVALVDWSTAPVVEDLAQLQTPASEPVARTPPFSPQQQFRFAGWSPTDDCALVAVWEDWQVVTDGQPDLYLWDVEAGTVEMVAPGALDDAWSPDGAHIALLVPGELHIEEGRLAGADYTPGEAVALNTVVIEADTGRVVTVAYGEPLPVGDQPYEFAWYGGPISRRLAWSPDGAWLLYWDLESNLVLHEMAGNEFHVTQGGGLDPLTARVAWSPTGRYFALTYANASADYAPYLAIIESPGVSTR